MSDIAVAITAHNRPHYLRQVIDSWQQVRGIDDVPLHFQIEPVNTDVIEACVTSGFRQLSCNTNGVLLGALSNPHQAIQKGFEMEVDFVVLGEDDSIVTQDALEYFSWAADEFKDDSSIIAVCSFQHKPNGAANESCFRNYFASVVWGTWRDRWEGWMSSTWGHTYQHYEWDFRLCRMCDNGEHKCIFPCISRSQHIGKYDGTHHKPDKYDSLKAQAVHDGNRVEWRRP